MGTRNHRTRLASLDRRPTPSEPRRTNPEEHPHGPENADHELRKAYNCAIELGLIFFWDRRAVPGVSPDEVLTIYKRAFRLHRNNEKLAAERWARTAKHLTRAFFHEAKIAYLEPRAAELPYLEGASASEYQLHETPEIVADLLDSVALHIPPGMADMPETMKRYITRGRRHLELLKSGPGGETPSKNELLRVEHVNAAYEYGRVLELMALAYEAESTGSPRHPPKQAA